jgi:hypothetical protein
MLVAVCTVCGFSIAVAATNQDGDKHFGGVHKLIGLAIFILVIFQGLGGYFRPGLPKAIDNVVHKQELAAEGLVGDSEANTNTSKPVPPEKSQLRQGWEYLHRFVAMTLLGLAWYNCYDGIILQAEYIEPVDEQKLFIIFWCFAGGISGIIIFIGFVIRKE